MKCMKKKTHDEAHEERDFFTVLSFEFWTIILFQKIYETH